MPQTGASLPRESAAKHLPARHCREVSVGENHRKLKCFTNSPRKSKQRSRMKRGNAVHEWQEKERQRVTSLHTPDCGLISRIQDCFSVPETYPIFLFSLTLKMLFLSLLLPWPEVTKQLKSGQKPPGTDTAYKGLTALKKSGRRRERQLYVEQPPLLSRVGLGLPRK